jgi:hypothetical protein
LISQYEPKNIYNADKTGLFVWALPTKSLAVNGESITGANCRKKKTYSVIVWEYGGRNGNPLVTGKAAKPRCFKNLKINNLPVIWKNNKKAWTSAATMEEWLNMFNAKMKKENRNVTQR